MRAQLSPVSLHVRVEVEEGFCDVCGSFDCAGLVPADETKVVLEIHICDQRRSYFAQFANEQQAIEFYRRKYESRNHAIFEIEEAGIPADFGRLHEVLNPTCEHGLSEALCYGPSHYASDEEIRMGY